MPDGAHASADADLHEIDPDSIGWAELEAMGVAVLQESYRKITSGRVRNPEHESIKTKQRREFYYGLNVLRNIKETRKLEELDGRLEQVEEQQERAKYR